MSDIMLPEPMTYEEYIQLDIDKYQFYINQDYTNKLERFRQELLNENPYIHVDISINYIPFNEDFKKEEYNQYKNEYEECVRKIQSNPLYKYQQPIFDAPSIEEVKREILICTEPSSPCEPISPCISEPASPSESLTNIFDIKEELDDTFNEELLNTTVQYFKSFTDTEDASSWMIILLKSPVYQYLINHNKNNIPELNVDKLPDGLWAQIKKSAHTFTGTLQSIIDDYESGSIKSPSHCKNMIVTLNVMVKYILNYPKHKQLFSTWTTVFINICNSYQQIVKKDKCIQIPENINEILCHNLGRYIYRLLNIDNTLMSDDEYNQIHDVFTSRKKIPYSLELYISMMLCYAPVRPNVLYELYWYPTNEQNGFSINENSEFVFHHNTDKNVNESNKSSYVIDHWMIEAILGTIYRNHRDDSTQNQLIYSFKLPSGNSDKNFNERIFKPILKALGDTENTIYSYNALRSLISTKQFAHFIRECDKRKHSISTCRDHYVTTFGAPI